MVRHCPRCELRFASEGELREHLALDHATPELVRDAYPAADQAPLYPDLNASEAPATVRRYLVVANQTLGGDALIDHMISVAAAGPADIVVVVPATHSADYPAGALTFAGAVAGAPSESESDEKGRGQAHWRLRQAVDRLRAAGVEVHGEVGSPDPLVAVETLLRREDFDEIIVSTLPAGLSRWLGMDLPQRIERRAGLPVTVIESD